MGNNKIERNKKVIKNKVFVPVRNSPSICTQEDAHYILANLMHFLRARRKILAERFNLGGRSRLYVVLLHPVSPTYLVVSRKRSSSHLAKFHGLSLGHETMSDRV